MRTEAQRKAIFAKLQGSVAGKFAPILLSSITRLSSTKNSSLRNSVARAIRKSRKMGFSEEKTRIGKNIFRVSGSSSGPGLSKSRVSIHW